ncbi:unnamed protein product [Pieris macdunnoughi]|uniref:Protease inhibitor n=1 Tax=Pieris macdunnoughi TaxID=345717 RepID=A0A821U3U0_9NEOP|nr:unnamed protein product [Pieris macdunnoughi]
MKLLIAISFLSVVGICLANTVLYPRGCIYVMGRCYRECEVGTRAYTTGCGKLMPEPTCDVPDPEEGQGNVCDYSACYCESPTVRHKPSGKCMLLEDCPKTKPDV